MLRAQWNDTLIRRGSAAAETGPVLLPDHQRRRWDVPPQSGDDSALLHERSSLNMSTAERTALHACGFVAAEGLVGNAALPTLEEEFRRFDQLDGQRLN